MEAVEYQCCFCGRGIAAIEEGNAALLTATNLRDWKNEVTEARWQAFYAHAACLSEKWSGTPTWENDVLFDLI